ncbi:hypothetical protein [Agaribacterium sp. ZY112]|uniref:hypothetical protein n=1 Tax=Agaribacterium sp. ZY112 TaxID=3233574 RepID=UPI003526425C
MKLQLNEEDKVGSAVRFIRGKGSIFTSSGRKIYIEPEAITFFNGLNDYDQIQVAKEIETIASIPSPQDGWVQKLRPAFFKAKGFKSNFILKYQLTSESAIISAIELNLALLGSQAKTKNERTCLYKIKRFGEPKPFKEKMSLEEVNNLTSAWGKPIPVTSVTTRHAAVNGMLNDLDKARWLMGTHLDTAYPKDLATEYTLFHNPTEGGGLDLYESAVDSIFGGMTENAKALAAVLKDIQLNGSKTKWIVHSQGGIIFKQALKYHARNYPDISLNKNMVVFHAGGNNKNETSRLMNKTGIKRAAPDRDNPFDLVPNIAGRNDLSTASIKRSLSFLPKVAGKSISGTRVESPHTLPFLSLEAYHRFLTLAGDSRSAAKVKKYMKSFN